MSSLISHSIYSTIHVGNSQKFRTHPKNPQAFKMSRCTKTPALRNMSGVRMNSKMHNKNINYISEDSLGLPFLFLKLIEELHFLPISCLHHSSELVHFCLHLQHVLIRKRKKTKIYTKLGNTWIFSKLCTCTSVTTIW